MGARTVENLVCLGKVVSYGDFFQKEVEGIAQKLLLKLKVFMLLGLGRL